jgi:hypothetical protein
MILQRSHEVMIRFGFAAIVTSCAAATILFSACGDSTFSSSPASDAQADDGISDASSASDSSVVVGDAGRILPITCVDGGHSLCDTFDEAKVSAIWTVPSACSQPFLDTTKSVSAPSSLSTNDVDSGTNCASVYSSVPSLDSTKFSSSFDVYLDSPNAAAFAPFFAIWVTTSDDSFYEIALTAEAPGSVSLLENLNLTLDSGSTVTLTPINAAKLVPNAWNRVTIEIDIASSNLVAVTVNDGAAVSVLLNHRPSAGSVSGYRVYLGIPNGGLTKAAAHFDDFVCDVTP